MNVKYLIEYKGKNAPKGEFVVEYTQEGILVGFINNMKATVKQLKWFFDRFPASIKSLSALNESRFIRVTEVPFDLSFDKAWNLYGKKVGKAKAMTAYNKLKQEEKFSFFRQVPRYKNYCRIQNRTMKDMVTYINQKTWNDELTFN